MTTDARRTVLTLDNLHAVNHLALRILAGEGLRCGLSVVELHHLGDAETLVLEDRAGQAVGDDLEWGQWDAATQTIRLASTGPTGEPLLLDLSGGLVAPDGSPIPAE